MHVTAEVSRVNASSPRTAFLNGYMELVCMHLVASPLRWDNSEVCVLHCFLEFPGRLSQLCTMITGNHAHYHPFPFPCCYFQGLFSKLTTAPQILVSGFGSRGIQTKDSHLYPQNKLTFIFDSCYVFMKWAGQSVCTPTLQGRKLKCRDINLPAGTTTTTTTTIKV